MNTNKNVLYITYDGLTDPLGQSQILPYLIGLTKVGYKFTILSFEKKDRYQNQKEAINAIVASAGIEWVPMSFTAKPPVVSKFYDAVRLRRKAISLQRECKFDMIHCRSYVGAEVGLALKKRFGVKFFFDMRGFWADEKKDAGTWNQESFIFRKVYRYYKRKEAEFISRADYIISLTNAGKKELMKWPSYKAGIPLSVIPCCSDMNHFTLRTDEEKKEGREILGLPEDCLIVSYLGSVGAWYMLDEMLHLFSEIKKEYKGAKFLFITHSSFALILSKLSKYNLSSEDLLITEASRQQVPLYVKASDINISFIKPVYSKLSSSPTKLGEVLAMGIPIITNSGVGDVEQIIKETDSGFVIHKFLDEEYQHAVNSIKDLLKKRPEDIRLKAKEIYSLDKGIAEYSRCYREVFSKNKV
jgi:glycosyltransferase involved in cell wall biosynthesis